MFDKFKAQVALYHEGKPFIGEGAECIINSTGITIDNLTVPMANIISYQKLKLKEPLGEYEYNLIIHVVNWVK
jgi:hypothetical protein